MKTENRRLSNARAVALAALSRVDQESAYVNLALSGLLDESALSRRDRAFATELTYGTLRWRGRLDWVLSHFVKRPAQDHLVRNILRLAAYQILFLPNIPAPVVVFESVQLAKGNPKTRHGAAFVNAVARKIAGEADKLALPAVEHDPVLAISVATSHPEWMVRRWIAQYGVDRVQAFMRANNEPAPLSVRANSLRCTLPELVARLQEERVEASPSGLLPTSVHVAGAPGLSRLPSFQEGLFTAQDEGSQLVSYVVAPEPGEVVWDVCSAPGTKSTHMAELMGDQGRVFASDIHAGRLGLVAKGSERLRLQSIEVIEGDARKPPGEPRSADRVLVDAPCSGVGVLRRRPDLRWQRAESEMAMLISLQREILVGAATLVRPGGILVYSTCSVDAEENQQNVEWFLKAQPEFALSTLSTVLPEPLLARLGVDRRATADAGYLQLWPDLDGTDGFFISRFVRKSS